MYQDYKVSMHRSTMNIHSLYLASILIVLINSFGSKEQLYKIFDEEYREIILVFSHILLERKMMK